MSTLFVSGVSVMEEEVEVKVEEVPEELQFLFLHRSKVKSSRLTENDSSNCSSPASCPQPADA